MSATLEAIRALLRREGVCFREVHHVETRTSEEAASARAEPIEIGGKAIVMKVDDRFLLFVLSAAREIRSREIRRHFRAQRTRFATREELFDLTGLVPGCVPPFGPPILDLEMWADLSIAENTRIAFNAASLTDSIVMDREDWQRVARPAGFFRFSR